MASAIVGRWGKSLAVRVPNQVAQTAGLRDGEQVDVEARGSDIVIRRPKISKEAQERALQAVREIIADSRGRTLGGIRIKDLIEEGRKR